MSETIRWGIIGCGDVTEVKSGPGFQKANGSELAAVMRRRRSLAEDYARRHGVPQFYDDADALIRDPGVDAVYIATPPGSHLQLAECVAAAGKPCYVEKPMARSYAECARMIAAFERANQPLFIAYYRRALPRFLRLRELIESGQLGTITGCRYRMLMPFQGSPAMVWRLDAEQSGGGLFLDIGSHVLDLLDYLLGEFVEYGGTAHTTGSTSVEDSVAVHFRTARGIVGSALWNFAASARDELLEIEGTKARLTTTVITQSPLTLNLGQTAEAIAAPDPPHVQQPLIQAVVDELLGRGSSPSTGTSAARTSRVMDAALTSFYQGRDDAFWERPYTWRRD